MTFIVISMEDYHSIIMMKPHFKVKDMALNLKPETAWYLILILQMTIKKKQMNI